MPLVSIVTPCYNEAENVQELYQQIRSAIESLPGYTYEHIFIDNASKDRTVEILREIAWSDPRVKVIVNNRNFGHIRSPYYAIFQACGEAVVLGIAGEYVGAIYTQVLKRPLVAENERINFDTETIQPVKPWK